MRCGSGSVAGMQGGYRGAARGCIRKVGLAGAEAACWGEGFGLNGRIGGSLFWVCPGGGEAGGEAEEAREASARASGVTQGTDVPSITQEMAQCVNACQAAGGNRVCWNCCVRNIGADE